MTPPITDAELTAWQKACDLAPEGPWHIGHVHENLGHTEIETPDGIVVANVYRREAQGFVATSREAMPRLIEEVSTLRVHMRYLIKITDDCHTVAKRMLDLP